jgi:hypothetical protein
MQEIVIAIKQPVIVFKFLNDLGRTGIKVSGASCTLWMTPQGL